jgi:Leucine-rich repeat (LRR) protein
MSFLTNKKLFGLDVNVNLSDVLDRNASLRSLNLNPEDLEIIAGSASEGVNRPDFLNLSRLDSPLYKTLGRYLDNSQQFARISPKTAGSDQPLFGNLDLNGSIDVSALRYRYLNPDNFTDQTIKFADLSTSRASAWSSSDPKATNSNAAIAAQAKIAYGASLTISTGGKLIFGTQESEVSGPRLQTSLVPVGKRFESEIPTHKIKTRIDGNDIFLYAMKGIPLTFRGVFRNLRASAVIDQIVLNGEPIPASWEVIDEDNPNIFTVYKDRGDQNTSIRFNSTSTRKRIIKFYYNPEKITALDIQNAGITDLPTSKFENLTSLNLRNNSLRVFPDFNSITPGIISLDIGRNKFNTSTIASERKIQNPNYIPVVSNQGNPTTGTVLDKIPQDVKSLTIGSNFTGSITQHVFANRFQSLETFNLSRLSNAASAAGFVFSADTVDPQCELPRVTNECTSYNVSRNKFRNLKTTNNYPSTELPGQSRNIMELTKLVYLNLYANSSLKVNNLNPGDPAGSSAPFSLQCGPTIETVILDFTDVNLPNLFGAEKLQYFRARFMSHPGEMNQGSIPSKSYFLGSCDELTYLNLDNSRVKGKFPVFNNPKLERLYLQNTQMTGGEEDNTSNSITELVRETTFKQCTELKDLRIRSNFFEEKPINANAFVSNTKLEILLIRSGGRITGNIPVLSNCTLLRLVFMPSNNFSGNIPNFSSNQLIEHIEFSNNNLSGNIPNFINLQRLKVLEFQSNNLTGVGQLSSLTSLTRLNLSNNSISGSIPDLSTCTRLSTISLANNNFNSYSSGSFTNLTRVRFIDISGNTGMSDEQIGKILSDLVINYNTSPRSGVTLNFRNTSGPLGQDERDLVEELRLNGWNVTTD